MPYIFFFTFSIIHNFEFEDFAITLKPLGNLITSSPWLIHTLVDFFEKKFSVKALFFNFVTFANPNSLDFALFTLPPNSLEIIWWPKQIPKIGIFNLNILLLNLTFLI